MLAGLFFAISPISPIGLMRLIGPAPKAVRTSQRQA